MNWETFLQRRQSLLNDRSSVIEEYDRKGRLAFRAKRTRPDTLDGIEWQDDFHVLRKGVFYQSRGTRVLINGDVTYFDDDAGNVMVMNDKGSFQRDKDNQWKGRFERRDHKRRIVFEGEVVIRHGKWIREGQGVATKYLSSNQIVTFEGLYRNDRMWLQAGRIRRNGQIWDRRVWIKLRNVDEWFDDLEGVVTLVR